MSPEQAQPSQRTKAQIEKERRLKERNPTLQPIVADNDLPRLLLRKSLLVKRPAAKGLLSTNEDNGSFEHELTEILKKDAGKAKPRQRDAPPPKFDLLQGISESEEDELVAQNADAVDDDDMDEDYLEERVEEGGSKGTSDRRAVGNDSEGRQQNNPGTSKFGLH